MTDRTGSASNLPGLQRQIVITWLVEHVPGLRPPLEASLLSGGHSNLGYLLTDGVGRRCVLRRAPLGETAGGAHDMRREHRIVTALASTAVPVPEPLAFCDDPSVNGSPFYVMAFVDAHVVDNPAAAERFLPTVDLRQRASNHIIDALADLHRVDTDSLGLGDVARSDGFLSRQLHRMQRMWEQTKTRELPLVDELHHQLVLRAPVQRYTGVVHSDFRFGNVMLADDATVAAVVDWELWTLGDVLADLGLLVNNWQEPDDDIPQVWMEVPPTAAGGFATRAEIIDRYATQTGFDLSALEYYRAFQHWKIAVIAEGVKRRYEHGEMATVEVDFGHLDRRVIQLAELAHEHLARA